MTSQRDNSSVSPENTDHASGRVPAAGTNPGNTAAAAAIMEHEQSSSSFDEVVGTTEVQLATGTTTPYNLGQQVSRTACYQDQETAANTPVQPSSSTGIDCPASVASASVASLSSSSRSSTSTARSDHPALPSNSASTLTICTVCTSLDNPVRYEVQLSPESHNISSQFAEANSTNSKKHNSQSKTATAATTTHISIMDESTQQQEDNGSSSSQPSSSSSALSPTASSSPPPQQQQQHQQPQHQSPLEYAELHWTRFTQWLHYGIGQFVLTLSLKAAHNPRVCIISVLLASMSLAATGYFTNFKVVADEQLMFSPTNAISLQHGDWLDNVEGFPEGKRALMLMIHANGDNVMHYEAFDRLLMAIDMALALPEVEELCSHNDEGIFEEGGFYCGVLSALEFWDHNRTLFEQETQQSDEIIQTTISQDVLPSGRPFFHTFFLGSLERDDTTGLIDSALTLNGAIEIQSVGKGNNVTMAVELILIDALLDLREEWMNEPENNYQLEFLTIRSIGDELMSTIAKDVPLVPLVFVIMTCFTCLVFFKRDKVQSRCMLGLGSIVTILMSLMSGFGICFIIGKPFTNMTMILPFVVFGVGLDDTFIITGAYFRTSAKKDTILRIRETMEEVGNSISLTTITTTLAFLMGLISAIPAIQWVCIYASITIFIDFVYQITFFVAILVLDEERIKANRRDCCLCIVVPIHKPDSENVKNDIDDLNDDGEKNIPGDVTSRTRFLTEDESSEDRNAVQQSDSSTQEQQSEKSQTNEQHSSEKSQTNEQQQELHWADKLMYWYADRLLRPCVKVFVLIGFTAFLGGCIYSATKLEQDFKAADFLSGDSYALGYLDNIEVLAGQTFRIPAFFRFVNQSDPQVQEQMQQYIDDLTDLPQFGREPEACWFRDFKRVAEGNYEAYANYTWVFEVDMTFNDRLKFLLSIPEISDIYSGSIAFDKDGNIEASRCWFTVPNVNPSIVKEQVEVLAAMKRVAMAQPINQGRDELAFFTYDLIYFLWEFYTAAAEELKFTTISGVVAITVVGFLLIPHWSATLFVTPLIIVLYADLLGTMQFSGLSVNPLTYVCLVISIGLLVDFLMHVILRYYESSETTREGKVKDTLRTMGASIFIGGLSTCLGVIPLAFSTSGILKTVYISFIAMVSLGLGHGLILLPVLLSYLGPTVCVRMNYHDLAKELHIEEDHDADENKNTMSTPEDVDAMSTTKELAEKGVTRSFDSDSSLGQPPVSLPTTNGSEAAAAASILAFMEDVDAAPTNAELGETSQRSTATSSVIAVEGNGEEAKANQAPTFTRGDSMDLVYPSDSISV